MNIQKFAYALLITAALSVPVYAASSLEAYTGVVGGSDTACSLAGGPVAKISAYFASAGGFGLLNTGNGISDCGLYGGISDVTGTTGPQNSATTLANTVFSSYPANSMSGSSSSTANYGSLGISTSTTVNGVTGFNGEAESVAFAIASDTLHIACNSCLVGYMSFGFTFNGSMEAGSIYGGGQMEVDAQLGSTNESVFYANDEGNSVYVAGVEPVDGTPDPGQPVPGCVITTGAFTCTNATFQTEMMSYTPGMAISFGIVAMADPTTDTVQTDPPAMSLSGIQVYDTGGNQISSFTITSDSGTAYGADGVESSSPEPATLLLAACALAAFAWLRRLRSTMATEN